MMVLAKNTQASPHRYMTDRNWNISSIAIPTRRARRRMIQKPSKVATAPRTPNAWMLSLPR